MKTGLLVLAAMMTVVSASAANLSQEPVSFTVARSDLTNQYAVLAWTLPADITNTVIYRAYGEGGPWMEIAETNDFATTWMDETAPLGVPCWYKIAFAERDGDDVRTMGDLCAATVLHRRCQLLERDWSDMTHVKEGVTIVINSKSSVWNGGYDDNGALIEKAATPLLSAALAFDNMLRSTPNFGNAPASGRHAIGVDLGDPYGIGFIRTLPMNKATANYKGITFYASNKETSWYATTEPAITEADNNTTIKWREHETLDKTPYRFVYASNPSVSAWQCRVPEIQIYGWPATAIDGYAIGAVDLSAVQSGSSVVLSWKDNGYGSTFNVERSVDGGTIWTAVATGLSVTSCTDTDIALDGTEYRYRIASVNGTAVSYSATVRAVPYEHADGVGLHRSALFPFISTEATDMTEYVSTGAVSIATATLAETRPMIEDVEGSHTNVYVTWTGKLIVPIAGSYTFTAKADGMASVWVDDSNVTRYSAGSRFSELTGDAIYLSAGEHDIRVAYWQGMADHGFSLYWDGAVAKEAIPLSQLKPVVPNALPSPWEGVRSFSSSATECLPSDARVNGDGSFDLAFSGADNRTSTCAYNFLYRKITGDFSIRVKVNYRLSKISGEKAGLMVAAGLSAGSPFESFLFRSNEYDLGLRSRRSVGGDVSEPRTVAALGSKTCWTINTGATSIYMRLSRKGNLFTYSYRTSTSEPWTPIYEYADTDGLYGDTVYIGPVAANVTLDSWSASTYRRARYAWRFPEIDVRKLTGMAISIQ